MTHLPHPLVSIVLCVYNGTAFLKEQLDSVLQQTYPNIELIVLDDLSTDGSWDLLQSYRQRYPHIRLVQNETNLGFNKNYEKGINLSKGNFISFCDQDDIWYPEKIAALVAGIGDAVLIYSNSKLIDETGKCLNRTLELNLKHIDQPNYKTFIDKNIVTGHTCLFSKKLVPYILPLPAGICFYDRWIALVASYVGYITYLDKILTEYRVHHKSVIQQRHRAMAKEENLFHKKNSEIAAFIEKDFVKDKDKAFIRKYLVKKAKADTGLIPSFGFYVYLLTHHNQFYPSYAKPFYKKLNYIRKQCL